MLISSEEEVRTLQQTAQHFHDPTSYFLHQVSHTAGTRLPLASACSYALFKMRFTFLIVRVEEPYHRKDKHSSLGAVDGVATFISRDKHLYLGRLCITQFMSGHFSVIKKGSKSSTEQFIKKRKGWFIAVCGTTKI